ncbi:MAG TPA: CATRA conflict system CASPASE/TPR repeat-associated protein [Streptosporangiaceae bacterium]|nr:CATRA conflict system CASPASE/TPR repeat-associated protein [Streptosporangiaceae bacterium]
MTSEDLTTPGMLAHVFLAAGGRGAEAPWERMRSLWGDVIGRFGLDCRVQSLAVPSELPRERVDPADGAGLIAAAQCHDASVWQAAAWADHDVLGVTVMMAPARDCDCARAWARLESTWSEVVSHLRPDGVIGETRIFLGLLAELSQDAMGLVRSAAPEPSAAGWWQHWDAVPLGSPGAPTGERNDLLIWEIGPDPHDGRALRRIAAIAVAESERQVDRFLWTNGDGTPAPLTRHLMHAARLRYQVRVFDNGSRSSKLRNELASLVEEAAGPPGRLRRACGSAAMLRTRVSAMREAAGIIDGNMRLALDLPSPADAAVGPLSEDRDLATWFGQRLDDEITRLDAAIDNARSVMEFMPKPQPEPAHPSRGAGPSRLAPAVLAGRMSSGDPSSAGPWAVIFTAIPVEYNAIRAHLAEPVRERTVRGTLFEVSALPGIHGSWRVALAQAGQGSTIAGVQLDRAVPAFEPEVALFIGTAGGRKDVDRGDVVVAEAVYDYESGESTLEGFKPRPRTRYPSWRLLQRARLVARGNRWQQRILPDSTERSPACFVKPIVTGGKVIAHDRSEVALMLDQYASDAVAVEMEGHGFLEGASVNPGLDALVIRGISDLLTGKNEVADSYWQPIASRHAAAFAVELLDSIGLSRI